MSNPIVSSQFKGRPLAVLASKEFDSENRSFYHRLAMAIVKINPMKLAGPRVVGYVLDYHSVSATPTGDPYHPFE